MTTQWWSTGRHFTAATQALNTSCSKLNKTEERVALRKQCLNEKTAASKASVPTFTQLFFTVRIPCVIRLITMPLNVHHFFIVSLSLLNTINKHIQIMALNKISKVALFSALAFKVSRIISFVLVNTSLNNGGNMD